MKSVFAFVAIVAYAIGCRFSILAADREPIEAQIDFPAFWTKFKSAVASGDKATVSEMDHGTQNGGKLAATSAATLPSPTPESTSEQAQSVSENGRTSTSSARSVSPDKQWEYKCDEYYSGSCAPKIVKAGTGDVVLDLGLELTVHQGEAGDAEVIWAADSKRFAFNYTRVHAHHTVFESVAFYQLRGDKWLALHSPADEASQRVQLAQLGKGHLPRDFNPRRCAPERDVLKMRNWTDANTAILYAPCYGRTSGELEVGFLFTLKFDAAGNWKIVKTHRMSAKELGERADQQ